MCNPARERRKKAREKEAAKGAASKSNTPNATKKKPTTKICRKASYGKCDNPNCKYSHDASHIAYARKRNPPKKNRRWARKGKAHAALGEETSQEEPESQTIGSDLPYIEFVTEEIAAGTDAEE